MDIAVSRGENLRRQDAGCGEEINMATINDQDRRAIETMVLSGLDMETLQGLFPRVPEDELKLIYEGAKKEPVQEEGGVISCNCS